MSSEPSSGAMKPLTYLSPLFFHLCTPSFLVLTVPVARGPLGPGFSGRGLGALGGGLGGAGLAAGAGLARPGGAARGGGRAARGAAAARGAGRCRPAGLCRPGGFSATGAGRATRAAGILPRGGGMFCLPTPARQQQCLAAGRSERACLVLTWESEISISRDRAQLSLLTRLDE